MADIKAVPKLPKQSFNVLSTRILIGVVAVAVALVSKVAWREPDICGLIAAEVSLASRVAYAGDAQYAKNTYSFTTLSDDKAPKCTVETGTTEDVATTLRILGAHRTPFVIKGSGHHPNPGFSSTTSVLVTTSRFSQITYDAKSQTAIIGAGSVWDKVYAALEPHGVTVVGGRMGGVGVSGVLLGGGYSYLTNQYGLAIDNVVEFELVKPDGKVINVTRESDPELFFGLRGGFNNFGVVTRLTLKTYPQGPVWGGTITYPSDKIIEFTAALAKFSAEVTDPKTAVVAMYNVVQGNVHVIGVFFYDGPEPPAGIFDSFLNIRAVDSDIKTRGYTSMIMSLPTEALSGHRTGMSTIPIARYTPTLLEKIQSETQFWGAKLESKSSYAVSLLPEPFLPNITQATGYSASAYPFDRTFGYTPFCILLSWDDAKYDEDNYEAVKEIEKRITQATIDEGQDILSAPKYPNYARLDMPLEAMYGVNLERLRSLKQRVDPDNVMGLAGGFKF